MKQVIQIVDSKMIIQASFYQMTNKSRSIFRFDTPEGTAISTE